MLAWFKFQAKIPSRSGVCVQGEWQKHIPHSPPLSKDEGLRHIGHSMSIGNLILGLNSVTISYLIRYESLLQNMPGLLLQNATVLLQNATVIKICDDFIKKCDSYYKLRQYIHRKNICCCYYVLNITLSNFQNLYQILG